MSDHVQGQYIHVADLYSVYSGKFLCPQYLPPKPDGTPEEYRSNRMDGIHDTLNHLTQSPEALATHQLPRARAAVIDTLGEAFPFLKEIQSPVFSGNIAPDAAFALADIWVTELAEKYGAYHYALPVSAYQHKSAYDELPKTESLDIIKIDIEEDKISIEEHKTEITDDGQKVTRVQQIIGNHKKLNLN